MPDSLTIAHFAAGVLAGGGLVAAAWKLLAGWQRINLSLQIEAKRTPSTDPLRHDLVCLVKLRKGDRATLMLERVTVKVQSDESVLLDYSAPEVHAEEADRNLNLTPGEETHFAAHCRVPKDAVCSVTAAVAGRSLASRQAPLAVWKATEISVPYLKS